jgi:malate synthase
MSSKQRTDTAHIVVTGTTEPRFDEVLSADALVFVAALESQFGERRRELLTLRSARQLAIDAGELPRFLPETAAVRTGDWTVVPPAADLTERKVEITGPVDPKMVINALNSGASVFMADFEDSASPTWSTMINGQIALSKAVRGDLSFTNEQGKTYTLGTNPATLMVRPRGFHLVDNHVLIHGKPISASFLDFGLYFFHNAAYLLGNGSGPYFYLPKLESHLEARLWNDVFVFAQDALGIPQGSVRATVLIETILAAFEMDEILYELRDHSAGLNAGRWDYIFSVIKKFRNHPTKVLPDREQITMSVPFMSAYTDLLVQTCHKRGAHAMGGMAAFIPSRRDAEVNERAFTKVRADKAAEVAKGHDGTWVAHPDLIPVAREAFNATLGEQSNQISAPGPAGVVSAEALLDFTIPDAAVTLAGVRTNVDVAIQYLASWLTGNGAVAIYNLMEDAATAEISRSQLWQWLHNDVMTADGVLVDAPLIQTIADEELQRIAKAIGDEAFAIGRFDEARHLLESLVLSDIFIDFLTLPAYQLID